LPEYAQLAGSLDPTCLRRLVRVALRLDVLEFETALAEVGWAERELGQPRRPPATEESFDHEEACYRFLRCWRKSKSVECCERVVSVVMEPKLRSSCAGTVAFHLGGSAETSRHPAD
jgi:hypothetical protein